MWFGSILFISGSFNPIFGRSEMINAILMHFGVKKLKFGQNGLTWFMIWTAVLQYTSYQLSSLHLKTH